MAVDPITDADLARRLLEGAVDWEVAPVLDSTEIDDLMVLAVSTEDSALVYRGRDLNRAASLGWQRKAGKVSNYFDVSLPEGMRFARQQVWEHCMAMAAAYANGSMSVTGSTIGTSGRGIGVIGIVGPYVDVETL